MPRSSTGTGFYKYLKQANVASGFHARQNEVKSVTPGFNVNPQIKLFEIGKVVDDTIRYMNSNYDFIRITHYVIMPNHGTFNYFCK